MNAPHPSTAARGKLSLKRDTTEATESKLEERLHKVLAQAGLGSRRALEQRISDGLVKVNGETATVGMSVKAGDKIELDGKTFVASALTESPRVLMYNKPEGEVTTREDPEGRPTVFESLPALKGARWISIGRLDINTTGLLLLTTDGELANAMMHPSFEVAREYVVRVRAPEGQNEVPENIVDRLRRGVALDDGPAKFDEIERIGGNETTQSHEWFRVVVKEGRNREVRRLWESQGCQVSRLKRVRYGEITLPQPLLRGHSQELPEAQVEALRKKLGLEDGAPAALTLQPVIGQRKAAKTALTVNKRGGTAYVNGHNTADEGRELRRFDNFREDRGRGRGKRPHGGLTVSGEAAAKQANKPFKQRKEKGPKPLPDGNPAAFRSWYVPDGVETGPTGHRNAGPKGGSSKGNAWGKPNQDGNKPFAGRNGKPSGNKQGGQKFGGNRDGGFAGEGGFGARGNTAKPQRAAKPYGHPGNAPSFPSDHATPGSYNPYGAPRDNRSQGNRNGGKPGGGSNRNAGPRPAGGRPHGRGNGPRG